MALNIKNAEVERLATEIARLTGETKTEAIRQALADRRVRLARRADLGDRKHDLLRYLRSDVWPLVPDDERGRRLTRADEDDILGYGTDGT